MANAKEEIPTVPYANGIIYDPEAIPFVERDEFIRSLSAASAVVTTPPLEQAILAKWKTSKLEVSANVARMARDYARYLKAGARLPKFSRWAAGMFPSDAALQATLAKIGQAKAANGELQFSAKCYDLVRAGVSPHFGSCFKVGQQGGDSLRRIAGDSPGIGIAFVNDANGIMKGRTWVYHAKRLSDDADVVVFAGHAYGQFDIPAAAAVLKERGFIPYKAGYAWEQPNGKREPIAYQNIPVRFYNDTPLWGKGLTASPL